MSKILLINPLVTEEDMFSGTAKVKPHCLPPLGLCWLAAVLREKGYEVKIIDAAALECDDRGLLEQVTKYSPDYIGISAAIISVFKAADYVRIFRHELSPEIKIIVGGPQITAVPELTMKFFPDIDAGVLGEGEITIVELIEALEDKKDLGRINGLILRDNNGSFKRTALREFIKDLDCLPHPAWDLLPPLAETYTTSEITYKSLPSINLVTSRGCPSQCIYCDRSVFGRRWRCFSPKYIIRMVKELITKYGIRDIYFNDDQFLVNKERIRQFCRLIIEENIKLDWSAVGRIDYVDKETVLLMKEAGCHQIEFGFESGSQEILDILKKDVRLEEAKKRIMIVKESGISLKGLFMVGCPGETKETLKKTKDFIAEMEINRLSVSAFTPLPGSEVYTKAKQYGKFEENWRRMNLRNPLFVPWGVTREMLNEFIGIYKRK